MTSQSNADFESDEPTTRLALGEFGSEIPEADAIEQHQALVPEDIDDEFAMIPMEASEADALEQSRMVPLDDDFRGE